MTDKPLFDLGEPIKPAKFYIAIEHEGQLLFYRVWSNGYEYRRAFTAFEGGRKPNTYKTSASAKSAMTKLAKLLKPEFTTSLRIIQR